MQQRPCGIASEAFGLEAEPQLPVFFGDDRRKALHHVSRLVGKSDGRVITAIAKGDHGASGAEIDAESQGRPPPCILPHWRLSLLHSCLPLPAPPSMVRFLRALFVTRERQERLYCPCESRELSRRLSVYIGSSQLERGLSCRSTAARRRSSSAYWLSRAVVGQALPTAFR